jgi:hypothetical protein
MHITNKGGGGGGKEQTIKRRKIVHAPPQSCHIPLSLSREKYVLHATLHYY